MSWVCDAAADCSDGSDEVECGIVTTVEVGSNCQTNQFECSSGECIELRLVCNNHPDCLDGSDEGLSECDAACTDNGGCPQSCSATPRGPVCQCNPGYNLTTSEGSLLLS